MECLASVIFVKNFRHLPLGLTAFPSTVAKIRTGVDVRHFAVARVAKKNAESHTSISSLSSLLAMLPRLKH